MGNLYNQKQYAMLYKNRGSRSLHLKIDLYNENNVKVDSFEGMALSGSVELNGESTYRRNAKLTTILKEDLIPKLGGKIWFGKKIGLQVGLADWDDKIVWYNMGKFAIDGASMSKDATSKSMDLNLLDNMAFLDGTLGGYLSHEAVLSVDSGAKISDAIRTAVKQLPKKLIDNFQIEGLDVSLVEDLEFNPNGTIYDIVKELTDLYMSQEFFFDLDGVFRVQTIRDRKYDPVKWDFTEDNMDLVIDYSRDIVMSNIKNSINIWGGVDEASGVQTYFTYRNRYARQDYSQMVAIVDKVEGDICHVVDEDKSYSWNGSKWEVLDFTVVPEFNMENVGEKIWTFSEDTIMDDNQAKLRTEYELKNTSNFAETINFNCLPIYLLDTNSKIKINDKDTGIEGYYLVESISIPLDVDGLMGISARKIYY